MESKTLMNCADIIDESICTVIILRYKVYRNDSGKIFGKLLFLKHKAENFLKEVFDDEVLFQNPTLQRTKQGLLELIQGLTYLCSGVTPTGEELCIPELPLQDTASNESSSYEMKFVKGTSVSDLWLCYVDNEAFLRLLQRLREKYDKDELQPFMFYPRIGEHVYFRQGINIFRGVVLEYVISEENKEEDKEEADVDIKVLNVDNSDTLVLPQNCFFQMDKEGTELPMQCVLCTSDEADISMNLLQKHKLNVVFHGKQVPSEDSPIGAQSVSISLCTDKNGVLVARNSPDLLFATYADAVNSNQILNRPCPPSADEDDVCEGVSDESAIEPDLNQTGDLKPGPDSSYSSHNAKQVDNVVAAMNNVSIDDPAAKFDKDKASMNSKEKAKLDSKIKPATAKPVERKDSSLNDVAAGRLKVTPNTIPTSSYHYLSGPQFHSTPMHYPGHYMPYAAATQHMNPAAAQFHFPQYPYGPYIPQTAPTIQPQPPPHSQPYYMPPSSSAYQSYVQPVAAPIMAGYFPSQPPYPGFYQVPPSQLPPSWPQVQPNYRVSTPSPVSVVSVAVNKAEAMNSVNSSANLNKPK